MFTFKSLPAVCFDYIGRALGPYPWGDGDDGGMQKGGSYAMLVNGKKNEEENQTVAEKEY